MQTKDLKEIIHRLEKENQKLKMTAQEHANLESFLIWMSDLCAETKMQFCGVKKFHPKTGPSQYVGFAIRSSASGWHDSNKHGYDIYGYLSSKRCKMHPDYNAFVIQRFSEIPVGITNTMWLEENYIEDTGYHRCGIGSAGLDIVKNLAKQLHCTVIQGKRVPRSNDKEELEALKAFYSKNGFQQAEGSCRIQFDMEGYNAHFDFPIHISDTEECIGASMDQELLVILSAALIRRSRIKDLHLALDDSSHRINLMRELGFIM